MIIRGVYIWLEIICSPFRGNANDNEKNIFVKVYDTPDVLHIFIYIASIIKCFVGGRLLYFNRSAIHL